MEQNEHSAIVEGLRAGTNEGLAAFYDLYADRLYDFARRQLRDASLAADVVHDTVLIVRSRIGQLRDDSKFRAWVYAIVRNEVRAKARARSRHVREEYAPEQSVDPDFAGDHDRRELASLVDEAVAGLTEREQEVFHLFARQGLSNEEIAAALELTHANAQKLVQRVRDRIARSAGALLVARQGRKDCSDLAIVLVDWDGSFSPLWRKRIARHVDECQTCERRRAVFLQPGGAVMAAPYLAAPASLRSRIFDSVANGVHVDLSRVPRPHFFKSSGFLTAVAGLTVLVLAGVVINNVGESPRLLDPPATTTIESTTVPPATTVDSTASAGAPATVSSTSVPAVSPTVSSAVSPPVTSKPKPVTTSVPKTTVAETTVPVAVVVETTTATTAPATTSVQTVPTTVVAPTTVAQAAVPTTVAASTTLAAATTTTINTKSVVSMSTCKDLSKGGAGITIGIKVTDVDGVKAVVAGRYKSTLNPPMSTSGDVYTFYVLKGSSTVTEPFVVEVRVTDTRGNVTTAYLETTFKTCP